MQAIQDLLTLAIEATVIIGFGAIALQDILRPHKRFMREFCPPINPYIPQADEELAQYIDQLTHAGESVPAELITETARQIIQELQEITEEAAEEEIATERSEIDAPTPPKLDIELNNLDAATLRKLCTQHQIGWRNFKGANRHMPKATMVFNLQQRLTA